jgi:FkbH-like protein
MNDSLYSDLSWLPRPPADFRERCRAIVGSCDAEGREVVRLAGYALNQDQLLRLSTAIEKIRSQGVPLASLAHFKLGILGNATLDPVVSSLVATAARHGIALECVQADYGQTIQEALSPDSRINSAKPDAVLLALDYRGLPFKPGVHDAAAESAGDAISLLRSMRAGFREHANAPSIVQTLAPPPETLFGNFDRVARGTLRSLTATFNAALVESIPDSGDIVLDVANLAETVGLERWYSPTQWNLAKFAFDARMLALYADHVCRIIAAMRGKSRKCLVLDLDNTLWGGVIGDDGLEGIVLGQGDATGEAHLELQRAALALRERGVVLAVSSKNEDGVARSAFTSHAEMLLREDHIAVFQANWNDKATNIKAIAEALSLGTDALVFVDDNPAERALVRQMLPEVAVPELPEDPALYARTLAAAGYFESIGFSSEDRQRAGYYQDNARRLTLQNQAGDLDSYLASLQMRIVFAPFEATGRSRIAQLINKSNQFNLTTRRYTELEVASFEDGPDSFTLQVRLSDVFGDNGMIGVVICRAISATAWEIDTWLMSCRVLGRRVEQMVLRELLYHARSRGIERLIGFFIPSAKNDMVRKHYEKLGFHLVKSDESGATTWEISTSTEVDLAPMHVDRSAFDMMPT